MMKRQRSNAQSVPFYNKSRRDSDDSSEETELIVRKHKIELTVEKVIEEGDTLQSLSLRYQCPIAELKRLNNMHRENEIFAKRTIKVPNRPFSLHLAGVHGSGNNTPSNHPTNAESDTLDSVKLNFKLNNHLHIPDGSSDGQRTNGAIEVNQIIFNSDLKPVLDTNCDNIVNNESADEEVHLLQGISSNPTSETVISRISFDGADADLSWRALLVCVVIVIFAIPLIYILYIAEHPHLYHHDSLS